MILPSCLTDNEMREFSLGLSSDNELARIAHHLETCRDCGRRASQFDGAQDDVVQCLRHPLSQSAYSHDPIYNVMAAEAKVVFSGRIRDYQLLGKIGAGGMGNVYKARHLQLGRIVAIKFLRRHFRLENNALQRFRREMQAVGKLAHPNIIQATDGGVEHGMPFLVMHWVDGNDLRTILREHGPLPVAEACEVARQTALGLHHLHQNGLVHRDIKPSNLMLAKDGTVLILDLGLAMLTEKQGELTSLGDVFGTYDYMAPEQGSGRTIVDHRADLYSLGCTLYTLLGGDAPFADRIKQDKISAHRNLPIPPLRNIRPDTPHDLERLIGQLIEKPPARRPSSANAVAESLKPFVRGADLTSLFLSPGVKPDPMVGKSTIPFADSVQNKNRLRWTIAIGAAAAMLIVCFGLLYVGSGWISFIAHGAAGAHKRSEKGISGGAGPLGAGAKRPRESFVNSVDMKLVKLSSGQFQMGASESEKEKEPSELPRHNVQISKTFYMAATEVTVAQWDAVMGVSRRFKGPPMPQTNSPVSGVTWEEAREFCEKLSSKTEERGKKRTYDLPTEAQWEYACRADTKSPFAFGDTLTKNDANFGASASVVVAKYKANAWGLSDMHGNVAEWCRDWFDKSFYRSSPVRDPVGPLSGTVRAVRGGDFQRGPEQCRSASRKGYDPMRRNKTIGFRIICFVQ